VIESSARATNQIADALENRVSADAVVDPAQKLISTDCSELQMGAG
jgi:hypothetical protein